MALRVALLSLAVACGPVVAAPSQFLGKLEGGLPDASSGAANLSTSESKLQSQAAVTTKPSGSAQSADAMASDWSAPSVVRAPAVGNSSTAQVAEFAATMGPHCDCCNHEEKISNVWASCLAPENRACASCSLYGAVHSHPKCGGGVAVVGEKICPVAAVGGSESITAGNAASFSSLWSCAAGSTGSSPQVALVMNPWLARTQHQLHIKTMPLDIRGEALAKHLEKLTACRTGAWHSAHFKCLFSKARLFGSMPSVFSEVFDLAGTGALGRLAVNPGGHASLATVGITVLFICEGKPVVLAHGNGRGGCSIEHAIYSR